MTPPALGESFYSASLIAIEHLRRFLSSEESQFVPCEFGRLYRNHAECLVSKMSVKIILKELYLSYCSEETWVIRPRIALAMIPASRSVVQKTATWSGLSWMSPASSAIPSIWTAWPRPSTMSWSRSAGGSTSSPRGRPPKATNTLFRHGLPAFFATAGLVHQPQKK